MHRSNIYPGDHNQPNKRAHAGKVAGTLSVAAAIALGMGLTTPAYADGAEEGDDPSIPELPESPGGDGEGDEGAPEAPGDDAEEGGGENDAQPGGDFQRGPDPEEGDLVEDGPFEYDSTDVSSLEADGFGGGTIYHPTDDSEGTFGAVAISPGFTASSSTMSWYGERLASHGFVAFTIDTNTTSDQPDDRGEQLQASLDYMTQDSDVTDLIDADRLAVSGHSMGGGGTLAAANENPDLKAAVPLTGWHTQKDWGELEVPTMVISAENDTIASSSSHSERFYESLPEDLDRAYMELAGANHFAPNLSNDQISTFGVSWMKRFVDEDNRYEQFLCPPPEGGLGEDISDYRDSCPHGESSGGEDEGAGEEDGDNELSGGEDDGPGAESEEEEGDLLPQQ